MNYNHLFKEFGEDRMNRRVLALKKEIEAGLAAFDIDLDKDVYINEPLLFQAVLDYFEDIYKLKKFEGIKKTNKQKIYGYSLFWVLRRKPIQIRKECDKKLVFLNETICVHILFAKIIKNKLGEIAKVDSKKISEGILYMLQNLHYNLKYRTYTAQTLELFLDGFLRSK